MAEYIDRDKLIRDLIDNRSFCPAIVKNAIENAPTEDVVEVVRCKDCKYRNTHDCKMWYQCVICGDYHHWERDDYFCSYGERKE